MKTRAIAILTTAALTALPALAGDNEKSAKITVMLRGVLGEGSVKAFQQTLSKVPNVKFKAADITKGEQPRFYSAPFTINITELKKTDIGQIAKAAIAAKTPVREELTPGINLVIYSREAISERTIVNLRKNLANVKGLAVQGRGGIGASITDSYYWLRLDDSGKARLRDVVTTLKQSGLKFTLTNPLP